MTEKTDVEHSLWRGESETCGIPREAHCKTAVQGATKYFHYINIL